MKLPKFHISRKSYQILTLVLTVALMGTGFYAYDVTRQKQEYDIFLQNQYQRAFRDLVFGIEGIRVNLDKADATGSTVQSNTYMSSIWRQSYSASENLGQLPIAHASLSNTAKYLTQVGDYCYVLSRQNAANKEIDDKQVEQLKKLGSYATNILDDLHKLEIDLENGKLRFGDTKGKVQQLMSKASEGAADVSFGKIEKRFVDYPSMIYDGPFSDLKIEGKPKIDLGPDINIDKAKELATKFVGKENVGKIVEYSAGKGLIKTFGLEIIPKDNDRSKSINIDVTKKGGKVLWMLNPRTVATEKLTQEQAIEKGKKFLADNGYPNLVDTYYMKDYNAIMITYIGVEENGTLVYPDMMKVKIALDNGEVVGFDANQYLMAHKKREIAKPKITEEQAKAKVNKRLKIERIKLAIIPLPGDKEQLCYEFKAKNDSSDFFVYINAENGNEENVLKIIYQDNGTLTQ